MVVNHKQQMTNNKSEIENAKNTEQSNSIILQTTPQRQKKPVAVWIVVFIFLLIISPFIVAGIIFKQAGVTGYTNAVKSFVFSKNSDIKSENGKVNILILGIGGKGHEGAELTDTMIFASVSLTDRSITLVSIPRDVWIPEIRAKINSAYYWGNLQPERGGGLNFAKEIVSKVTGQNIDYALVMDFSGFQDIIDTIGGIDVVIDNSFSDTKYPIAGRENDLCGGDPTFACRYKTISFEKGTIHMDGATALEFSRSREGDNGENTDFARSARQQKIISAVGVKVLSFNTIVNPVKDYKILLAVKSSVETDLTPSAIGILTKTVVGSRKNITSKVLPADLLINPSISNTYDRQYVLIPKTGSGKWEEIIRWFSQI
jgi:LCP family protein required for cell wall assembly